MNFYLCLVFLSTFTKFSTTKYCYWNAGCSYKYFSSETLYDSVRGDLRDSTLQIKGCEPISIWSIHRDGKTKPGKDFEISLAQALKLRDKVAISHVEGNSSLCAQDIENLRSWSKDDNIIFEDAQTLTKEGFKEIYGIGNRLKNVYPDFIKTMDKNDNIFGSALYTLSSTEAFLQGIFQDDIKNISIDTSREMYDHIAPFINCDKYQTDVKQSGKIFSETELFKNTSDYNKMMERMQRRLGIKLSSNNITVLYDMCKYFWSGTESIPTPWCALFTSEDLQTLEYIEDLKHYYLNGYGTLFNSKFGGEPLRDLYEQFLLSKEGKEKKIVGYFTHASMMDMIYVALGFFKDELVLKGSYRIRERKWRTSTFLNYGSNIIAVMNKCTNSNSSDYNISLYLNEKRLNLCPDGMCTWEAFEKKFKPFMDDRVDFKTLCTIS